MKNSLEEGLKNQGPLEIKTMKMKIIIYKLWEHKVNIKIFTTMMIQSNVTFVFSHNQYQ